MLVCSIGTRPFLAQLRVLARSLEAHLPGSRLRALVIDAEPGELSDEPFDVVLPGDLDLPAEEWATLTGIYDAMSMACALKPLLLRRLLVDDDAALLLDADMRAQASLDGLAAEVGAGPVLLSRHLWHPAGTTFEHPLLLTGTHNAGLVGVRRDGTAFLDWWWERVRRHAVRSYPEGLYYDQHFLDLAPSFFPTRLASDPGVNVLLHGLETRGLAGDADRGWEVDGVPLRLLHAGGGFDPAHPWGLAAGVTRETLRPSRSPALASLFGSYREDLLAAGWEQVRRLPYRYGTSSTGLRLDRTMRRVLRDHVLWAEAAGVPRPPSPFDPDGGAAFTDWLREPPDRRREAIVVSRYLTELRFEEPALAQRVPDLLTQGRRYLQHVDVHRDDVPEVLRAPAAEPGTPAPEGPFELTPGITLAGPLAGHGAAGDRARRLAGAIAGAGTELAVIPWSSDLGARRRIGVEAGAVAVHDVNLLAVEAPDVPEFDYDLGATLRSWRYTVALWALAPDPATTGTALTVLDEVWVASPALAEVLPAWTHKPVSWIAPPVEVPGRAARSALGLPEGPLVGTAVDLSAPDAAPAATARAAVEAAHAAGAAALLVMLAPEARLIDAEWVLAHAGPEVAVREAADPAEAAALLAACDAQLAPGPGMPLQPLVSDVAAAGVPTVALRGTDEPAALAAVLEPAPGTGAARPADAAAALRDVLRDPAAAGAAPARHLVEDRSPQAVGRRIAARLAELTELDAIPVGPRGERPPPAPEPALRPAGSRGP